MYKKISLVFFLFFISLCFQSYSQSDYFETYDDYLLLKGRATNRTLNFNISPRSDGITNYLQRIWYRPSVKNSIGFGFRFKGISFSLGFKLSQNNIIKETFGESGYFDLQVHSYGKKLGYDIFYQNYESFFVGNLDVFANSLLYGDSIPRRDDLRMQNISANIFWVFNSEKFSYRAAFVHDISQKKSGGSFILTTSLAYTKASADSSFIPPNTELDFVDEVFFNNAKFYTTAIAPGYAYTLATPKGWYASLGISTGIGFEYHETTGKNISDYGVNFFLKGIGRASVGYNKDKWLFGLNASTDIQNINLDLIQYRTNNLEVTAFVGYRIKSKFMAGKKSFFDLLKIKRKK